MDLYYVLNPYYIYLLYVFYYFLNHSYYKLLWKVRYCNKKLVEVVVVEVEISKSLVRV